MFGALVRRLLVQVNVAQYQALDAVKPLGGIFLELADDRYHASLFVELVLKAFDLLAVLFYRCALRYLDVFGMLRLAGIVEDHGREKQQACCDRGYVGWRVRLDVLGKECLW